MLLHIRDISAVALVAEPETDQRQHREQPDCDERGPLQPRAPPFEAVIGARKPCFLEDHVAQQASDEVSASAGRIGHDDLTLQTECSRHRAHHPVDRAALLRPAGEIDPAQQCRMLKARRAERFAEKALERGLDSRELLWKTVDERTPSSIGFLLQAPQYVRLELFFQQAEFDWKISERLVRTAVFDEWKSDAPNLFALVPAQVVKEIGKACQQVA